MSRKEQKCEQARKAYLAAFTRHAYWRMTGILPYAEIKEKVNHDLDHSEEWRAYQEAWLVAYGTRKVLESSRNGKKKRKLQSGYLRGSKNALESRKARLRMRHFMNDEKG